MTKPVRIAPMASHMKVQESTLCQRPPIYLVTSFKVVKEKIFKDLFSEYILTHFLKAQSNKWIYYCDHCEMIYKVPN